MPNFFEKRDRWGQGLALWVVVGLVVAVPPACWALKQVHLENDVTGWLPDNDPGARMLAWYRESFPTETSVVMTWKGSSLTDPRVEQLASTLRGIRDEEGVARKGNQYVTAVTTPRDVLARMIDQGVERDEALRRLTGVLLGSGPVQVELTDAGRKDVSTVISTLKNQIHTQLGFAAEIVDLNAAQLATNAESDELLLDEPLLIEESAEQDAWIDSRVSDLQITWSGMHANIEQMAKVQQLVMALVQRTEADAEPVGLIKDCFLAPGEPVAISIALNDAGLADQTAALESLREMAASIGIPKADQILGGSVVVANELNKAVKKSGWNRDYPLVQIWNRSPMLLSCLVALVLSFWMLRSVRLAVLVLAVTLYTVLMSVALVPVTGGSMNMVLVVMPTLLMVVTVSAGIHVANYWKHAAHKDMRTAIAEAANLSREPVILAGITSAIGQASLMVSPLVPVRDFGLYGAIGSIISMLIVLYALPALLQFWPAGRPDDSEVDSTAWQRIGAYLARNYKAVMGASIAVSIVCSCGLFWFRTETKVIRYFPDNAHVVQDYEFLEGEIMGIVPVDIIVRFDQAAQKNVNFLERMEKVRKVEEQIRRHAEISGTISLADFQPMIERPGADASTGEKMKYHRRANAMADRIREKRADGAAAFITVPTDSSEFHNAGDELWRITAQASLLTDKNYTELTAELDAIVSQSLAGTDGASHVVTGLVPVFMRTQQIVLDSLVSSFGSAFATIAIVMMIISRSIIAGAICMIPNILPLGVVFGVISWYGVPVDIGTMITASIALGLAVDATMHLLTWFREGIREGKTRQEAIAQAMGHCAPAMWQTSAVVTLGMLMLYPSELLLVSRFGWMMAALTVVAVGGDLIMMPAMLSGILGRLVENTVKREAKSQTPATQSHPPVTKAPHFDRAKSGSRAAYHD